MAVAPELQWNSQPVLSSMDTQLLGHTTFAQGCEVAVEGLGDVATVLANAGGDGKAEQLAQLRSAVGRLLKARHSAGLCERALQELKAVYQAGPEATDFVAELAQRTQQLAAAQPYEPSTDTAMRDFEAVVRGGAGGEESGGEQIDDDIVVEGGQHQLAPNASCPISTLPLLSIVDPVQDSMGVVYERSSVEDFLRKLPPHRQGRAIIMAGSSHHVTLAELRPADKVIKEKRRQARRQKLGVGTQAAGGVEDVLDV